MQLPARFTPPLSKKFETDGDRLIELMKLCWVTPESPGIVELDEWQKWLMRAVLERYPKNHPKYPGELRYRQILISMARQQGKTIIGGGLQLDSLAFAAGDVLCIASNSDQATIIYNRVKLVIESWPWLKKRFKRTTETRGIQKADGRGMLKVLPAKEAAAQGRPFRRVILDEGHLAKAGIWTAITKALTALKDAQAFMITTAGDENSKTLINLYEQAEKAIAGDPTLERFGVFIWEAPPNAPLNDPDAIKAANPAVECGRIPLDRVLSDIATQPDHEIIRYTHNRFIHGSSSSWLPSQLLRAAAGHGITNQQGSVFAVSITKNWETAVIAAANTNGEIQETEIVKSYINPTEDQLFNDLIELFNRHSARAIALDDSQLGNLAKRFKKYGIPTWQLWRKEIAAACSSAYALFAAGKIRHNNDPLLITQSAGGRSKYVGESWFISSKESTGQIDALTATIYAVYTSSRVENTGVQVY